MQDINTSEFANEHPVTFGAKLIPSLMDGTKTVTRRPILGQPPFVNVEIVLTEKEILRYKNSDTLEEYPEEGIPCPYGHIESRLWIQEPFLAIPSQGIVRYLSDNLLKGETSGIKWELPKTMPREYSRLETRVTAIYPETLLGITAEEAALEMGQDPKDATVGTRMEFFEIWNSIYGRGAHQRNPWVWVIRFKKCSNIK